MLPCSIQSAEHNSATAADKGLLLQRTTSSKKDFPAGDDNNNVEIVIVDTDGDDVFGRQDPDGAVPKATAVSRVVSAAGARRQDSGEDDDDEYVYLAVACCDCGDLFPTRNELLLHRVEAHSDRRPHQCPACMATFHRADQLDLHKRTHTQDTPHGCTHCGQRFTLRSHVSAHARALHAAALAALAAEQHQQHPRPPCLGHGQEFRCQVCSNRVFHSASGLSNHMRCHSDERPFACQVCEETFKYRSHMVRHVKKQHPFVL